MKNILFVCSANKQRSKTGEDYFSSKYPDLNFDSAGTNWKICQQEGTNPLTKEMAEWADIIYVMEKRHKDEINRQLGSEFTKRIQVLNIPDRYTYYQKELIAILEEKISDSLQ